MIREPGGVSPYGTFAIDEVAPEFRFADRVDHADGSRRSCRRTAPPWIAMICCNSREVK